MKKKKSKGMQTEIVNGIAVVVKGIAKRLVRNEDRMEEVRAIASPVLSLQSQCEIADLIPSPSLRRKAK